MSSRHVSSLRLEKVYRDMYKFAYKLMSTTNGITTSIGFDGVCITVLESVKCQIDILLYI